jgi:flagellar hook capping protein FlgD
LAAGSTRLPLALALGIALTSSTPAATPSRKIDPGMARPAPEPAAAPDVFGPGAVLTAGQLRMKVTNWGYVGNVFPDLSADPAGQWPGNSGVEYLSSIRLAVAAVNPQAAQPEDRYRVSQSFEWRPPTLDPVDHIYAAAQGTPGGARFVNEDGDVDPIYFEPLVDEDFLDGRDNDGDGFIDEDFAAIGDQMLSLVMRDDTPQAIQGSIDEPHIPLGLECRQIAWCYHTPGFDDFDVVDYTIINRSGHTLDSLFVGWQVDMDCGPTSNPYYFIDDRDLPGYPHGTFTLPLAALDPRFQLPHDPITGVSSDSALCPRLELEVNGFAVADDDGDGGQTPGVAAFLLVDQTTDPLGITGPTRTGFRTFRSYRVGTPWGAGGAPTNDSLRFALMSGNENVDNSTGFVTAAPGGQAGDYVQWCSVGPYRNVPNNGSVHATVAFAVQRGRYAVDVDYAADYASYKNGTLPGAELLARHPLLRAALVMEAAFAGTEQLIAGLPRPDWHGRETPLRLAPGSSPVFAADCRDAELGGYRRVDDREYTWFDFDCDYCTGAWSWPAAHGYFHVPWVVPAAALVSAGPEAAPPPRGAITAYPNPMRDESRVEFDLPERAEVRVSVLDLAGRQVRLLADERFDAGPHAVPWDGRDGAGIRVPAGVYSLKIAYRHVSRSRSIVVVR